MRADSHLLRVITAIRESHPDMLDLYMNGQCYAFSLILRSVNPKVELWYDQVEGHAYGKLGSVWYDIRGAHYKVSSTCQPLCHKSGHKPHRWGKDDSRRLIQTARIIKL